ncbi:hypothetical protein IJG44_10000 [bacterium]|nr:hypothetical protein [bacterium]
MKKIAIFLIMFLFFSVVMAEPVSNEVKTAESGGSETAAETEDAPKKFYIQPALGVGTGFSLLRTTAALDIDFLLKRFDSSDINLYTGFDFDFRYMTVFWWNIIELALQANVVVDIDLKNQPHLKSVSVWASLGLLLLFDKDEVDEYYWSDYFLVLKPAWGFGTDLVFKNGMVLKLGLDGFLDKYPDLTVAVGYRF